MKQTVEKERSPPDRDLMSPAPSSSLPGGVTFTCARTGWCVTYVCAHYSFRIVTQKVLDDV